jgi:hypothetical protein
MHDSAGDAPDGRSGNPVGIPAVLVAWRAAERDLDHFALGSDEWRSVQAEFVRLRASYQRLFQEKLRSVAEPGVPAGRQRVEQAGDAVDATQVGVIQASAQRRGFGECEWPASGPPEHHLVGPHSRMKWHLR